MSKCTREHWPKEWLPGFIKTTNTMGIMTSELSPAGKAFADFSAYAKQAVLDIGASYGVSTYPALDNGAQVIACDIDAQHLEILSAGVPAELQANLSTQCAPFPEGLDFPKNSLSAIHISQVLHFFSGEKVVEGLNKCYRWLEHNGRLFIVVVTPHHPIFANGIAVFDKQKALGHTFPGVVKTSEHAEEKWVSALPELFHFFMPDTLSQLLSDAGFKTKTVEFFCYKNMPSEYKHNGQEYLYVVAEKE